MGQIKSGKTEPVGGLQSQAVSCLKNTPSATMRASIKPCPGQSVDRSDSPISPHQPMKLTRTFVLKTLRLLTMVSACAALTSHADDYADISQLLQANKFSEALAKVDSQLVTKPADPQFRFLKGVIQRNMGKPAEAISTFTKLTEDYPELPEPYNNLAVLYASQSQYDKARSALEMAIRTNPSYATAHENLGDVYARLASRAYNKALQLDNGNTAVPPKLALIRELFKPNLANPRPVVTAAASTTPAPVAAPATPSAPTTAPVKPVSAAAAPAMPQTKTVPAPVPATVPVNASKAVEAAVMAWAKAWSAKDMASYLAAYSPEFDPAGQQSRAAWEQVRTARITGKSRISVTLSDLQVKLTGETAVASFKQAYKADALSVSSRKTLNMHRNGDRWLITKESTGR